MVQPERRVAKVNKFVELLYNPMVWLIFFGIYSFFIRSFFVTPLRTEVFKEINRIEKKDDLEHIQIINRVDWNSAEIQTHKQWCDKTLTKAIDNRPTHKELELVFDPLKAELLSVKNELLEIKKILLNKKND